MSRALLIAALCALSVIALWLLREPSATVPPEAKPVVNSIDTSERPNGFPPAILDARPVPSPVVGVVDVCGYGPFKLQPDGEIYPPSARAAGEHAIEQAAAAMAAGRSDLDRAIALYVQASTAGGARADSIREKLAQHASATREPSAYALAFYFCQKAPANRKVEGSCALISSAQWAQLEPDNLIPWIHEATLAAQNKDASGRDAALSRAAQATASRLHFEAILTMAEHSAVKASDPASRLVAYSTLTGIFAAVSLPGFQALTQQCGPKVTMDADRRRLCSDLATVLTERGSTFLEISIGTRIGERAGWPAKHVDGLRDRIDALTQATQGRNRDLWSCNFLNRAQTQIRALAHGQELAAAEQAANASGFSRAELAQQWRDRRSNINLQR